MVKLIPYIHRETGESGRRFLNTIQENFGDVVIELCDDLDALEKVAQVTDLPGHGKKIFILYVDSETRLTQLYEHVDMFDGERVIALIPENKKTFLIRVNRFYPRFTGMIDGSFLDVIAVLQKMIQQ